MDRPAPGSGIVLPATEPETEWVRGRALRKVSPTRRHARLQLVLGRILEQWALGRGEVGTEWRFRVTPPGSYPRPLVPDIAYLSYERTRGLSDADLEVPLMAPDIAVEILSPGDRAVDIDHKRDVYLRAGAATVIVVDPEHERLTEFEPGELERRFERPAIYASRRFPGLTISLEALFGALERPRS